MQGRHVRPVASPHCLSVFLWASEPLRCNTCAQSLLWHFLLIHFSQIFSLYTSQVCFYPCRAFDLLPECSLACPGRFRPGWPLGIFSRDHFISTSLFFDPKRHDGCIWLLRWPEPIPFIVFSISQLKRLGRWGCYQWQCHPAPWKVCYPVQRSTWRVKSFQNNIYREPTISMWIIKSMDLWVFPIVNHSRHKRDI